MPANSVSERELTLLRRAAEQGNVEAQWQLGLLYAGGDESLKPDYVEASEWIQRAAEQGFARAQSVLAWLYANGYGVQQDDDKAGQWYMTAAKQGGGKDQYMIATMYRFGRYGVACDLAEMLNWYQLAAQQNYAPAQYALGKLLIKGDKVARDDMAAFQWLSLAHVNGSKKSEALLKQLMQSMPAEQLEQAKQLMMNPAQQASLRSV